MFGTSDNFFKFFDTGCDLLLDMFILRIMNNANMNKNDNKRIIGFFFDDIEKDFELFLSINDCYIFINIIIIIFLLLIL